jgi:hypothetical protein
MLKAHRIMIGVLAVSTALNLTASAQSFHNAGSVGAQFLRIGVGARAMGMGGAFGALSGDATTLPWNPAGIGTISTIDVSVEHTVWVAGIKHNFLGLVVPITDQVNLSFHTVYLTSGQIEITTIDQPEGTGTFYDTGDIVAGLTSSVRLTTQLTFATTVKYIEERIYDVKSSTLAADLGVWCDTGLRSLALGFSVTNLGFDQTFNGRPLEVHYIPTAPGEPAVNAELQAEPFGLPLSFRAGGLFDALEMMGESFADHELLIALDFTQQSDTPERLAVGAEYTWQRMLSVRSGYLFNADELGWGVGGGVRIPLSEFLVGVDYAASSLGRFGIGHRVGLSLGYGQ